jgi:hypothetical protein
LRQRGRPASAFLTCRVMAGRMTAARLQADPRCVKGSRGCVQFQAR